MPQEPPLTPTSNEPEPDATSSDLGAVVELPPLRQGHAPVRRTLAAITPLVTALQDAPPDLVRNLERLAPQGGSEPSLFSGGADAQVSGDGRHVLHGWITKYPIYAALWFQPADAQSEGIVRASQVVLLAASSLRGGAALAEYLATVREAALCVRRVCLNKDLREIARQIITVPVKSMRDAKAEINGHLNRIPETQVEAKRLLRALARLVSYAERESRPPTRQEQTPGSRRVKRAEERDLDMFFEPAAVFVDDELDTALVVARTKSAAAPVRETPARRHVAVSFAGSYAASGQSRVIQAKNRARAMATSVQRLPFASDRLQLLDIESLLAWLRENDDNKKEALTSWLLVTMCLTGSDIEQASSIVVEPALPTTGASDVVRLVLDPLGWCLPVRVLKDAYFPPPELQYLFRRVSSSLFLPLPRSFPAVQTLESAARRLSGMNLFGDKPRHMEAKITRALSQINRETGSRLTIKRVAEFLERLVADTTKDEADGAFFSPRDDSTGCAARLYYYSPPTGYLVETYMKAWEAVAKKSTLDWSWSPSKSTDHLEFVGSAGCPIDARLPPIIGALEKRTRAMARGRRGVERSIEFHNAFTTYTTIFGMWSSALRAVRDPIEVELVDPLMGFLGVSEKDTDEYATSRVVPLTPVILEQLNGYARHREVFLETMDKFGIRLTPHTWLFYVEGKCAEPVTPKRLEERLAKDYPFPLNSQRHYLRTRLRENGVSGMFVDALLGHGAQGEEPYGRYSAISPRILRHAIEQPLQDLLKKIGWRVIPGMQ